MPPNDDLWDWIEAGGTGGQLRAAVDNATAVELPSEAPSAPGELREDITEVARHESGLLKQLRNDTGNADRLILKDGDRLRYCPAFRKWLLWDGRRWAVDDKGAARRLARPS